MTLKRPFPAYNGPDRQVFVCYAHADAATVYPEITALHERGINIWYDEGIEVGGEWRAEIAEALDRAESVLFYQSEASSQSRHCVREVSYALNRDIPVIRIDLDGSELPPGLRLGLEFEQAIDRKGYSKADYAEKLLHALNSSAERSLKQPIQTRAPRRQRWWLYAALGLMAAALVGGAWWTRQQASVPDEAGTTPLSASTAIAVLPFEDISPDGDQAYLGNGIADELRLELQHLDGLRVAGRTSSNAYAHEDSKKIGELLHVESILEGSVRREGNRVRITVQLTNADDGFAIWSESYNRELEKIFEMQEEIATSVAGSLGVRLGVGGVNAFHGAGTQNVEAYEAYLRAQSKDWSEEGVEEAIPLLEQAIQLDPNYAAAWSVLAVRILSSTWDATLNEVPQIQDKAEDLALHGVQLDPESATAQSNLAIVRMTQRNWIGSEQGHKRAIELLADRQLVDNYANMLMRAGRTDAAQEQFERAMALEPLGGRPPGLSWHASLAQGRIQKTKEMINTWATGRNVIENSLDLSFNEQDPEALKTAIRALAEVDDPYLSLSYTHLYSVVLAEFDSPQRVLSILRAVYQDERLEWARKLHDLAMLAAYFGDPEFALKLKDQEIRVNTARLGALWYPFMSEVRQLPQFKDFVREINLVEYWRAYGWADACRPLSESDFACS